MKKFLPLLITTILIASSSSAQVTRYVVQLKNKGNNPFSLSNPIAYLSQRAIDRRTKYGIAIDSTDLPITPSYVTQIRNVANVTILNISKWLNSVTIQTSDANAITTINGFAFVQNVNSIAARIAINNIDHPINKFREEENLSEIMPSERTTRTTADFFNYGTNSFNEINLHTGQFLHNIGLRGQGMQIAMLDNGFNNYTASNFHAFDSANANGQVLGGWDFVAHNATINDDGTHGMSCFSTIVANVPGVFVGMAPKANFWLFQTEDNSSEYPIEEHNWVCGAERADSSGADVISTSLGYNIFDSPLTSASHTYTDMNGNTTMAAIGADLAAKKGILVFAAVGNEGTSTWHFLITPSDGDSVIAVGAVNSSGVFGSFSSYGPSSDGQVKPDVASIGVSAVIQNSAGGISLSNGTSFATPKMAGLGTCLWQGFPEFNNMKIRSALWRAGSRSVNPNDSIGYGIPNMKTAFTNLLVDFATSSSSQTGCAITINWTSKDIAAMRYEVERKAPGDLNYSKIADVSPQAGTILANHSYQFINNLTSGSSGTFSYRIRQIIDTATATFTAAYIDTTNIIISSPCIVTGTVDPNTGKDKITVLPNPAVSQATLIVETTYAVTNMPIAVYDMKGRLMYRMLASKGTGKVTLDLPIGKLAKGKYIIRVYNNQKTIGTTEFLRL